MGKGTKIKLTLFIVVLTGLILGLVISGPQFFYKMQMQFGFKGKIDIIEQCLTTKGCAITTDELELYNQFHKFENSDLKKRLKKTDFGKSLVEENQKH